MLRLGELIEFSFIDIDAQAVEWNGCHMTADQFLVVSVPVVFVIRGSQILFHYERGDIAFVMIELAKYGTLRRGISGDSSGASRWHPVRQLVRSAEMPQSTAPEQGGQASRAIDQSSVIVAAANVKNGGCSRNKQTSQASPIDVTETPKPVNQVAFGTQAIFNTAVGSSIAGYASANPCNQFVSNTEALRNTTAGLIAAHPVPAKLDDNFASGMRALSNIDVGSSVAHPVPAEHISNAVSDTQAVPFTTVGSSAAHHASAKPASQAVSGTQVTPKIADCSSIAQHVFVKQANYVDSNISTVPCTAADLSFAQSATAKQINHAVPGSGETPSTSIGVSVTQYVSGKPVDQTDLDTQAKPFTAAGLSVTQQSPRNLVGQGVSDAHAIPLTAARSSIAHHVSAKPVSQVASGTQAISNTAVGLSFAHNVPAKPVNQVVSGTREIPNNNTDISVTHHFPTKQVNQVVLDTQAIPKPSIGLYVAHHLPANAVGQVFSGSQVMPKANDGSSITHHVPTTLISKVASSTHGIPKTDIGSSFVHNDPGNFFNRVLSSIQMMPKATDGFIGAHSAQCSADKSTPKEQGSSATVVEYESQKPSESRNRTSVPNRSKKFPALLPNVRTSDPVNQDATGPGNKLETSERSTFEHVSLSKSAQPILNESGGLLSSFKIYPDAEKDKKQNCIEPSENPAILHVSKANTKPVVKVATANAVNNAALGNDANPNPTNSTSVSHRLLSEQAKSVLDGPGSRASLVKQHADIEKNQNVTFSNSINQNAFIAPVNKSAAVSQTPKVHLRSKPIKKSTYAKK